MGGNNDEFDGYPEFDDPLNEYRAEGVWSEDETGVKTDNIIGGLSVDEMKIVVKQDFLKLINDLKGTSFEGIGEINRSFIKNSIHLTSLFNDPDGYMDPIVGFLLKITVLNSTQKDIFNNFLNSHPDIKKEYLKG